MDTFNFIVSVLIMLMALQMQQLWIVFAVLVISILTSKDMSTVIAFIISAIVLFFVVGSGEVNELWPVAIVGLIVVAILLGSKPEEQQQGGYGDMLGGLGGGY
ncbi:MAG: hypothetical protein COV47_04325 [Candidatus Diapherotrites archaeon CG11_big_fil_rev_8_21_14_0_20_37_9]|nr:MAG: hypothetical protein COV47_04325 [Candidatus Diapherotrites archaeon CG11_big_fil_rev_8_21_14_0_20_37_9]